MTIFDISREGRTHCYIGECDVPSYDLPYNRAEKAMLPSVDELTLVRHYTKLSKKAYGVDDGFYPLGSCTMKYNPKLNEAVASQKGFTDIHPLQDNVAGAWEVMGVLGERLQEITGMDCFTLQPAAGAHGEYTALQMVRAYHLDRGEPDRNKIIVPDSAHGTNPASAAMTGFSIVNIPSTADGVVDLNELEKACANGDTACFMLTNPNTLGVFDGNIKKIAEIVHKADGLLYYDGANLNPIMGLIRPGDMGFDLVHLNLHKTFSTPHGGGGPGSGPVGCKAFLKEFLPAPIVVNCGGKWAPVTPEKSIGRVKNFYGNFLVALRALCYIETIGLDGMRESAMAAVINANYLMAKLKDYFPVFSGKYCMHEFVMSCEDLKKECGVSALDFAKAIIDAGMHPPTMYFPLIVHEALMFEPTETESKETLDMVAEKIIKLYHEAKENPEKFHNAPVSMPITRPDEVTAARNPVLIWQKDNG